MAQMAGDLSLMWQYWIEFVAVSMVWPSPGFCGHLGSEHTDRGPLLHLPLLSETLCLLNE